MYSVEPAVATGSALSMMTSVREAATRPEKKNGSINDAQKGQSLVLGSMVFFFPDPDLLGHDFLMKGYGQAQLLIEFFLMCIINHGHRQPIHNVFFIFQKGQLFFIGGHVM